MYVDQKPGCNSGVELRRVTLGEAGLRLSGFYFALLLFLYDRVNEAYIVGSVGEK